MKGPFHNGVLPQATRRVKESRHDLGVPQLLSSPREEKSLHAPPFHTLLSFPSPLPLWQQISSIFRSVSATIRVPDKIAVREPGNKRAFSRLFSRDQALRACQSVARLDRISLYARISRGAHGLVSTSDLLFLLYFIFGIRTLI